MDLTQRKLTKAEWTTIEVPASADDKRIYDLICAGYHNVNLHRSPTQSLLTYMKIAFSEQIDTYLYVRYLQAEIKRLHVKFAMPFTEIKSNEQAMKKADLIRLNNMDKLIPKDQNLAMKLEEVFGKNKAQEWVDDMINIVEASKKDKKTRECLET